MCFYACLNEVLNIQTLSTQWKMGENPLFLNINAVESLILESLMLKRKQRLLQG